MAAILDTLRITIAGPTEEAVDAAVLRLTDRLAYFAKEYAEDLGTEGCPITLTVTHA